MNKKRIWELDALRGLCILAMIIIHFMFDLRFFAGRDFRVPAWFAFFANNGGTIFILISGICATLSSRSFRRGITVFAAGLLVSYVTLFLDVILHTGNLRIWFGILHLLGVCMMLYPIFKKLPFWALALLGTAFIALGFWFKTVRVPYDFLFPIGLRSGRIFVGSDYFPIFPGFGWFLIGAAIGKSVYKNKKTLLPNVKSDILILRLLQFIGRHSLEIYLIHQPVLFLFTTLLFYP